MTRWQVVASGVRVSDNEAVEDRREVSAPNGAEAMRAAMRELQGEYRDVAWARMDSYYTGKPA